MKWGDLQKRLDRRADARGERVLALEELLAALEQRDVRILLLGRERAPERPLAEPLDERLRPRLRRVRQVRGRDPIELARVGGHHRRELLGGALVIAPEARRHQERSLVVAEHAAERVARERRREPGPVVEAQEVAHRVLPLGVGQPREHAALGDLGPCRLARNDAIPFAFPRITHGARTPRDQERSDAQLRAEQPPPPRKAVNRQAGEIIELS